MHLSPQLENPAVYFNDRHLIILGCCRGGELSYIMPKCLEKGDYFRSMNIHCYVKPQTAFSSSYDAVIAGTLQSLSRWILSKY